MSEVQCRHCLGDCSGVLAHGVQQSAGRGALVHRRIEELADVVTGVVLADLALGLEGDLPDIAQRIDIGPQPDGSPRGVQCSGGQRGERGLARAVRTEHRPLLALVCLPVDAPEEQVSAQAKRCLLQTQPRGAGVQSRACHA